MREEKDYREDLWGRLMASTDPLSDEDRTLLRRLLTSGLMLRVLNKVNAAAKDRAAELVSVDFTTPQGIAKAQILKGEISCYIKVIDLLIDLTEESDNA